MGKMRLNCLQKVLDQNLSTIQRYLPKYLLCESGGNYLHNESGNREMHKRYKDLMGHGATISEPLNDRIKEPINLSEREQKIINLMRNDSTLTRKGSRI